MLAVLAIFNADGYADLVAGMPGVLSVCFCLRWCKGLCRRTFRPCADSHPLQLKAFRFGGSVGFAGDVNETDTRTSS